MKIIAVEISVEHVPDETSDKAVAFESGDKLGAGMQVAGMINETFRLSVSQCIGDEQSTAEYIANCAAELLRRYKTLNGRKTN